MSDREIIGWRDNQGDLWVSTGVDNILSSNETAEFPEAYVVKKWGPLTPVYSEDPLYPGDYLFDSGSGTEPAQPFIAVGKPSDTAEEAYDQWSQTRRFEGAVARAVKEAFHAGWVSALLHEEKPDEDY